MDAELLGDGAGWARLQAQVDGCRRRRSPEVSVLHVSVGGSPLVSRAGGPQGGGEGWEAEVQSHPVTTGRLWQCWALCQGAGSTCRARNWPGP